MPPVITIETDARRAPESWEATRLTPRTHKIIQLSAQGMSNTKIAELVDMSPQGVGLILRSQIVQDELGRITGQLESKTLDAVATGVGRAREIIDKAAAGAAQLHADIIGDSTASRRERQISAEAILDRAFNASGDQGGAIVVLNADRIHLLQIALQESRGQQTTRRVESKEVEGDVVGPGTTSGVPDEQGVA